MKDSSQADAEDHHSFAKRLSKLVDRAEREEAAAGNQQVLAEIADEYHDLLQQNHLNHEPEDDELFRAQHRNDYGVSNTFVILAKLKARRAPAMGITFCVALPVLIYVFLT